MLDALIAFDQYMQWVGKVESILLGQVGGIYTLNSDLFAEQEWVKTYYSFASSYLWVVPLKP